MLRIYLPRLRLAIVAVMFIVATFGSVLGQDLVEPSIPELKPAFELLRQHRNDEALKIVQRFVKANEANAAGWYFLGMVYIEVRDFNNASKAFEKAMLIQPDLAAEAHSRFAFALMLRNVLSDAESEARKALSVDPQNVLGLFSLGMVNLRRDKRDEALENANAVIALTPDFAPAHLLKSQATMILKAADRSTKPQETKANQRLRYREAAPALAQYVDLLTNAKDVQFWREQLTTLEFYASDESVYLGRDVTTKARVISKPEPSYTEDARVNGIEGTVVLKCVFAADGTIQHILVLRSLTNGLTEQCVKAAKKIKFKPATVNGAPVSMYLQLEYNFNLY